MFKSHGSYVVGSTILLGLAWLFPTSQVAYAQQQDSSIRKGDFFGQWGRWKVKFSIEEIHDDGRIFDGIGEFLDAPLKGIRFGINGKVNKDKSLLVVRHVAGDTQVARVGPPKKVDGHYLWEGKVTGIADPEDGSWLFELRIPLSSTSGRESVSGAAWVGSEDHKDFGKLQFELHRDGKALMHDVYKGKAREKILGEWSQSGDTVVISFSDCEYKGTVADKKISGTARFTTGSDRSTWEFRVGRLSAIP